MNIEWLYMTKAVAKREGFTHHGSYQFLVKERIE